MTTPTMLNCFLILIGAIIMLTSIIRVKGLATGIPFVPERQQGPIGRYLMLHRALMAFFFCGYLIVLVALAFNYSFLSGTFVSVIFLFGAVFVLIGIDVQSRLLSEVQVTLKGILPICAKCEKIRMLDGNSHDPRAWKGIEEYISERTDLAFSHGYCPNCFDEAKKELGRLNGRT